jgi:hypothetical protein
MSRPFDHASEFPARHVSGRVIPIFAACQPSLRLGNRPDLAAEADFAEKIAEFATGHHTRSMQGARHREVPPGLHPHSSDNFKRRRAARKIGRTLIEHARRAPDDARRNRC